MAPHQNQTVSSAPERISLAEYRNIAHHTKKQRQKKKIGRPEEDLQRACMEWCALHITKYPDLEYLFHPANGGGRSAAEAGILKATGVKSGVPDLMLPFRSPTAGFAGLALELKSPTGELSENQRRWLTRLSDAGYLCAVIRDLEGFERCVKAWYAQSLWIRMSDEGFELV